MSNAIHTAMPRAPAVVSQVKRGRRAIVQNRRLSQTDLDAKLDQYAIDPLTFAAKARELAADLDRSDTALEIADPATWRKPKPAGSESQRLPLKQQFRADIESFITLGREDEAKLARRVEFARIRLDRALEEAGLSRARLPRQIGHSSLGAPNAICEDATLPERVYRRWLELHALRMEVVERNLYLVLINVERYSHTSANQADLIQEGSTAIFRAVDGFDWRRGLLFRTYAVHWLNQAFRSYLYNFSNTVRVPVYLQKALKHVNDAKQKLGDPNAEASEIAKVADLPEGMVQAALTSVRARRSLDVNFEDDETGSRLMDSLHGKSDGDPYTTALEDVSLQAGLGAALDRLGERERFVIEHRFGIGLSRAQTLAEVAEELHVSLERVRQIQVRAIGKLRTPRLLRQIDPFLN